jgi:hypothetical protein
MTESTRSSAYSTPTPPRSPTVAASSAPCSTRSKAPSGSRACAEIAGRLSDMTLVESTVNGQPGLVGRQDGVTVTVFAFAVADGRITHIWVIRNPEKLRPWTAGS